MHIELSELRHQEHPIELLEIVSLEGRYYMARVFIGGQCYGVTDHHDALILYPGACAAREDFHGLEVQRTEVIPAAGTDEMIGMPVDPAAMRVPM